MSDAASPERAEFEVVFDGGSLNNPGRGYGSYRLRGPGGESRIERLSFGDGVTNNEAEYRALIHALEDLLEELARQGRAAESVRLVIRGDSQLVLNQVAGRWKVTRPNLAPLNQRARELVGRFGQVELLWHPRLHSVQVLGH